MLQSFFNYDNPFWNCIRKCFNLFVLSTVFTFFCIPIFTIGPACAALYYTVVKVIRRERSYCIKEFLHAFKSNLKQGIIVHLILLILTVMMFVTDIPLMMSFINTGNTFDTVLLVLFIVKAVLLLGMICWIYPVISRFDQPLILLCEKTLIIMLRYFPSTILNIIVLLVALFLIIFEPLLLAIVPGLAALLMSFLTERTLQRVCDQNEIDKETTSTWFLGN